MSRYNVIKEELDTDPLNRIYSSMSDQQVVDDMNLLRRQHNKTSITGNEIFEATVSSEYAVLTDSQKQQWLTLCSFDFVDPFGNAAALAISLFSVESATILALQSLRVETISRGAELSLGKLEEADIRNARTL